MRTASPKFHRFMFVLMRPLFLAFIRTKIRLIKPPVPELPEHFLLISNHVTNYDPFLVAALSKRHMYFVATEHILSLGFLSRLLTFFIDPIGRPKGGSAAGAVMETLRRLKAGHSVALFAEGNCSWNGQTQSFPEATGKMVRASGAPLVTCRIRGGYFAYPRWAYGFRRGPVTVEFAGVYQPEELKKMKPDEINRLIAKDIYVDAYADQEEDPAVYRGRNMAKGLEHVLLLCPHCGRLDSLRTKGNVFSCICGLKGSYDEYGTLCINESPFTTITEWDRWQRDCIAQLPAPKEGEADEALVRDPCLMLLKADGHEREEVARGEVTMSKKTFRIGELAFALSDIVSLEIRLRGTVSFSVRDGSFYELKPLKKKQYYSGRKYKLIWDHFGGDSL